MVPSSLRIPLAVWTNMSSTVAGGASGIGFPFRFEAVGSGGDWLSVPGACRCNGHYWRSVSLPRCATSPKTCSPPVDDDDARTGLQDGQAPEAEPPALWFRSTSSPIKSISAGEDAYVSASRLLPALDRSRNGRGGRAGPVPSWPGT